MRTLVLTCDLLLGRGRYAEIEAGPILASESEIAVEREQRRLREPRIKLASALQCGAEICCKCDARKQ